MDIIATHRMKHEGVLFKQFNNRFFRRVVWIDFLMGALVLYFCKEESFLKICKNRD